jgi:hypothetical protein
MPVRTLKFGGVPISKRVLRSTKPGWKRAAPRRSVADPAKGRVRYLPKGGRFIAFQKADGTKIGGSREWFGNRSGDIWVHSSRFAA